MLIWSTDAPEDYDGFGTRTLKIIGRGRFGPLRQVEVRPDAAEWQRARYLSGLYCCVETEAEMATLVRLGYASLSE